MNPRTTSDLNSILQWLLIGGSASAGTVALLNALSDIKDSSNKAKLEKQLNQMAQPYNIVKIDPKYIKDKSRILSPELKSAITEDVKKTAAEDINQSALSPTVAKALKWIAGAGGLVGGAVLSNKLYNMLKQKSLQSELEDAKSQYYTSLYMRKRLEELNEEQNKDTKSMYRYASSTDIIDEKLETEFRNKYAGILSSIAGLGVAGLAGAAIAHIILARNLANAKNPILNRSSMYDQGLSSSDLMSPRLKFVVEGRPEKVKRNGSMKVKDSTGEDIESIENQGKPEEVIELSEEKLASILDYNQMLMDEACEGVIKMASELEKKASTNGNVNDVITAVALGYIDDLHSANNFDDLCDKARAFRESTQKIASEKRKALAVSYIVHDPIIGSMFIPYAASEVLDQNESLNKVASQLDNDQEAYSDSLINIALANIKSKGQLFEDNNSNIKIATEDLLASANENAYFEQDAKLLIKNILEDKIEIKDL